MSEQILTDEQFKALNFNCVSIDFIGDNEWEGKEVFNEEKEEYEKTFGREAYFRLTYSAESQKDIFIISFDVQAENFSRKNGETLLLDYKNSFNFNSIGLAYAGDELMPRITANFTVPQLAEERAAGDWVLENVSISNSIDAAVRNSKKLPCAA